MSNLNPVFDSIVKNHFPTDESRIMSEHKFAHPYFIDGVNYEQARTEVALVRELGCSCKTEPCSTHWLINRIWSKK